jgi:hypothetical protein
VDRLTRAADVQVEDRAGMKVKFVIPFALLVCSCGAFGQRNSSFYVSATGDDANPGSQRAPWRTVQHAADTVRAGSTVNVRGGIYEERVSINASGNASDGFITFRSYPGETAILDAGHLVPEGRSGVLTLHNQSYVRNREVGNSQLPHRGTQARSPGYQRDGLRNAYRASAQQCSSH